MKVAFDVQGTLVGPHSDRVIALFNAFQILGCKMTVWSFGGRGMAQDAIDSCGLTRCTARTKSSKSDFDQPLFDLCVDDDSPTAHGLSASHVILVQDIPEGEAEIFLMAEKALLAWAEAKAAK